ncbi:MAG: diguanylate phosphodiesterase [Phyllobacteriaceae bacterium]|nr:diguanylate phosphodiesterase [Phyllobacteriaceae bacterium]
MQDKNRKTVQDQTHDEFYIAFVQSLFENGRTLMMGVVTQIAMLMLVYWKTGDPVFAYIAIGILPVGLLRSYTVNRYRKAGIAQTLAEARRREWAYIAVGALHGAALGVFTVYSIYFVRDEFAEVASISLALATAVSIPGRNYGSSRMVFVLNTFLSLPISATLIARMDVYHVVLGLLLAPFLFAIQTFSTDIRDKVLSLLREKKKASALAVRFDKALNTMSHGLVMLDAREMIVVANSRASDFFGLRSAQHMQGRTFHALLNRGVAAGLLDRRDARYIAVELSRAIREGRNRKVLIKLTDGRYFELSAREGDDDLSVITFEDVSSRIASQEKIRYMARFDALTGLANRGYFQEIVAESLAEGDPERMCAMLVLDLDDFKGVNDSLGHPVGDALIFALGERLNAHNEDHLKVSRFGGDEFMVFFDGIADEDDLREKINALYQRLKAPADVAGNLLSLQVSGGAVMAKVRDTSVDSLIVKADLALYKAKGTGKNSWELFEETLDRAFRERQRLKGELRGAIERDELTVLYQPIVDARTLQVASCEALCRWHHPELGNIPPSTFIPLAEEMGIISMISAFVLKRATLDCAELPGEIRISVNLSANDFRSPEIVATVERVLKFSGLEPSRLEIEVTETALVDDKAKTWAYLEELKVLGVTIALDDFGTGYSNLGYLNALPLDKIKVDRSFLSEMETNPKSLELLKGVVELSRRLQLGVTIEGVETEQQFRLLAETVHPDYIQGFLFGAPLSKRGIAAMIQAIRPLKDATRRTSATTR